MVVASQTWVLSIPGCSSLKEKRAVVRSLRDRLRSRFNVSVSETGSLDRHATAELSLALVAGDRRFAESVLDRADRLVQEQGRARIVSVRREMYT